MSKLIVCLPPPDSFPLRVEEVEAILEVLDDAENLRYKVPVICNLDANKDGSWDYTGSMASQGDWKPDLGQVTVHEVVTGGAEAAEIYRYLASSRKGNQPLQPGGSE